MENESMLADLTIYIEMSAGDQLLRADAYMSK